MGLGSDQKTALKLVALVNDLWRAQNESGATILALLDGFRYRQSWYPGLALRAGSGRHCGMMVLLLPLWPVPVGVDTRGEVES